MFIFEEKFPYATSFAVPILVVCIASKFDLKNFLLIYPLILQSIMLQLTDK